MLRLVPLLTWAGMGLLSGCTRGDRHAARPDAASAEASPERTPALDAAGSLTPSVFSAPIAATRMADAAIVAGLVAAEGTIQAMKIAGGKVAWTSTALSGVAWVPDSELRMQPAGDGVALVWRGLREGKSGRTLVTLGPRGERVGGPIDIGTAFCGTRTGLVWTDPHRSGGPTHVRSQRWANGEIRDMIAIAADRDPGLVCGENDVVVLGDGEDDLIASVFAPGDAEAQRPWVAIRDSDFGDDDEREHDAYSIGDDLGLVRVGGSGSIAIREAAHRGPPGPWRRLKHALAAEEDVVAVDGDSSATLIVFTREASKACPDSGTLAESVRVLRVDRKLGEESLAELAPPDCTRARGPFWIASGAGAPVVVWVDRFASPPAEAPPIAGLSFRVIGSDGFRSGTIEQQADALTDANCDSRGCSAAALLRARFSDGMAPGSIRLLGYP